jgi:hypothetical protein
VESQKEHSGEQGFPRTVQPFEMFHRGAHDELERPIWMRGVLFDKEGFELVKCYNGTIETAVYSDWTTPGSLALLDGFINNRKVLDSWSVALQTCSQHHNVTCSYHTSTELARIADRDFSTAVLGVGAYGRVFAVKKNDTANANEIAMKIVIRRERQTVEAEFNAMREAASLPACSDYVIAPVENSFYQFQFDNDYEVDLNQFETVHLLGWSYLLKEVGSPFPSDISDMTHRDFTGILTALTKLHEADRCHCDARVDNFVLVGNRWKIVDLRDSSPASPQRKINDFMDLYKSFYPGTIPPAHAEAMKGFVNDALSVADIDAIFWGWITSREVPIEAIADLNNFL